MNRHPFLKTHHKALMSCASLAALPPDAGAPPPAAPCGRPHEPSAALPPPRRWNSTELLADGALAEIAHGDQVYRLRLTALGKLILTK